MTHTTILKQLAVATMTLAAADITLAQQPATPELQTVYVTGSNLKSTGKQGISPVQTVTQADIKASGANTLAELLRTIPSMGSNGNFDTNDGGFSRGVSTASMRGLSSTSTLILLNGRRITPAANADPNDGNSTLYDLNSIPLSAIDHVEVLKDGAGAVYGSDAIAGVINFITKNNYQGLQVSAHGGANDDNRFGERGANLFWGKGDLDNDGYNLFITADVSKRDRTRRNQAKDVQTDLYRTLNGRYATPYGSTVSDSPVFYRETTPNSNVFTANQANAATRLVASNQCDPSQQLVGSTAMGLAPTSVWIGRRFCNFDTSPFLEAQSGGEDASFMSRGVLKLGQDTRAFVEIAGNRTERAYTAAPITIGTTATTNFTSSGVAEPFQAILPIGHPDNPFPNARSSLAYRFENSRAGTETVTKGVRLLAGLEGTLGSWDWNTGLLYNQNKKQDTYFGRLYLPVLRTLNTGTSLAQLAANPDLTRDVSGDNRASILQWDVKANTSFGALPGGPVGLAVGAEVRREKLDMTPDALLASGQIFGLVNTIISGQRLVKSAYTEVRLPLLKSVELELAGRLDKYPNIKTNFVPKVGSKWTITDAVALRGSYSKGLRAPGLSQVTPGGAQFFLSDIYDPKRCETDRVTAKPGANEIDCKRSVAGTGGANPELVPEKSKSTSLGVILAPAPGLDLTVDLWRIRQEGQVVLGSADAALRNEASNPDLVLRDPNPVNWVTDANGVAIPNSGPLQMVRVPWINQGSTEVRGIDLSAAYRKNLGAWGSVGLKLDSTYMSHYAVATVAGDKENNVVGGVTSTADWRLSNTIDLPRWKSSLTGSWSKDDHALSMTVNYIGPVSLLRRYDGDVKFDQPFCNYGTPKDSDAEPDRNATVPLYEAYFPSCSVKSWTTVGVGYTYTGFKNLTLGLNILNLFDQPPPYDPRYGTNAGAPLAGYTEGLSNNTGRYFKLNASYVF